MNTFPERHKYEQFIPSNNKARWADPNEMQRSPAALEIDVTSEPCLGSGLPLISDGRRVVVDNSDTHTLAFGSTGSKKSRNIGMPLLNMFALAGESFICTDVKGELYDKTSGLVANCGYKTIVLDLRDLERSDYWNPLALPYELYHGGKREEAVALLNDLINALAAPMKQNVREPYWITQGSALAFAHLLFFIETASPEQVHLYSYAMFVSGNSSPGQVETISKLIAPGSLASVNYDSVLTVKKTEVTFGCIASQATSLVNSFIIRKSLCKVLSRSSFDLRAIAREKTALYIVVPDEKTTLHFLVSMFIKQLYEALISEAQRETGKKLPIRLNFVLDEFCNIPTIPDFASMITAARSRNMRFFLTSQGMRQMREKYGNDAETIKGNCDNWVFLASREYDLLQEISNLCGEKSDCTPSGVILPRPLISVSELQRLEKEKGEALILHGRQFPFVTELPDIDDYQFPIYPPIQILNPPLPELVLYDPGAVWKEITSQARPMPFSEEVYGKSKDWKEPEDATKPTAETESAPTQQEWITVFTRLTGVLEIILAKHKPETVQEDDDSDCLLTDDDRVWVADDEEE